MKLFYSDHFDLPLPPGHRFPMAKYRRLRERIAAADHHRSDLLLVPPAATDDQLLLAHTRRYVEAVQNGSLTPAEMRRIGFPWSLAMVERSRRSSGATLAASRAALVEGIAANMAGGTHHAMRDAGEGYCVFNDAAVAILSLRHEGLITRAAVIDCDVHQGNGTADILGSVPGICTFSIHGRKNFPLRKIAGTIDVELEDGCDDATYLTALEAGLAAVDQYGPFDLIVYLAGADPYAGDRLGRLQVSKEALSRRDELVMHRYFGSAAIAVAMAGGYAREIDDIVDIHAQTLRIASELS